MFEPVKSETWITASQAAALMGIRPSTVVRRVQEGKLLGKQSSDLPFDSEGNPTCLVLLEHLPQDVQYRYHLMQTDPQESLSLDLTSPRETFGDLWLRQFLDLSSLLSKAKIIRREYHSSQKVTAGLTSLAHSYGISLRTLYRYEGKAVITEISKVWLDPFYLQDHLPESMCLLSCDLAFYLWLSKNRHYSQNDILRELLSQSGKFSCSNCVYRESNPERDTFMKKNAYPLPVCRTESDFMKVPATRYPVNKLLSHIPPQLVCFCREGFRTWNAAYGHFLIRDKPILTNLIWQGDHHVFNCFVRVPQYRTKAGVMQEREVLVRPVLTAWMDTASGCIVGWVISILPNASTIAEAFCRAVVYTVGDSFHGLPSSILVDQGKDYRSALLEDLPHELEDSMPEDSFLNRRFAGMGILPALNISVYHALPYHPQSKSIERLFGTIESRWISKLPGWCHSRAEERPIGFQKALKRSWERHELFSMEEFVNFFRTKVLPEYHGTPLEPEEPAVEPARGDDMTGEAKRACGCSPGSWHTASQSKSPLELYHSLPKARDLTPDWKTMSVLKMQRKNNCRVYGQGIRFRNQHYWNDELAWYVGDHVDILFNTAACKEDSPLSLTVIYQGRFICEAGPATHYSFAEESPEELQPEFDAKSRHTAEMKATYTRLSRVMGAVGMEQKDILRKETYAAAIDEERDRTLSTDLSSEVIASLETYSSENAELSGSNREQQDIPDDVTRDKKPEAQPFTKKDLQETSRLLFGEE